jgi:hypothetical protein
MSAEGQAFTRSSVVMLNPLMNYFSSLRIQIHIQEHLWH